MKMRTIKLSFKRSVIGKQFWRVEQITDSTRFNPGEMLERNVVDELCDNPRWKVTLVEAK